MKRAKSGALLHPDSRGRVQLPVEHRRHPLFELQILPDSSLRLVPLKTTPVLSNESSIWLNPEVTQHIMQSWKPMLQAALSSSDGLKDINAIILFGSRARADALNSSDFDLALVSDAPLGRLQLRQIETALESILSESLSQMRAHGVSGELSAVNVFTLQDERIPPALFFSVAEEGVLLAERSSFGKQWKREVAAFRKAHGVEKQGSGRTVKWSWAT